MPRKDDSPHRLIQHGADFLGVAVGAAADFVWAPGTGALASVAFANALKELAARVFARREHMRIGAVAFIAADRISARLLAGHPLRDDGFFVSADSNRSPGEELFEGVLMRARDQYQERKLRHFGYFLANLAFAEHVSPNTAHLLLLKFERLTYRQLCILSAVARHSPLDVENLLRPQHTDPDIESLKREEMELHEVDIGNLGLLRAAGEWSAVVSPLGALLHELAGLEEISSEEIDPLVSQLTRRSLNC